MNGAVPSLGTREFDADVLVVGTGPMGATTALALAGHGVRVHAVTRQNWLADTPRAHVTNLRAMEILRSLGLEAEVLRQATSWELMGDVTFTTSLTGRELVRIRAFGTGDDHSGAYRRASPCTMVDLPQPLLEPILLNAAATRGASFSFNTLYRRAVEDAEGVTVTLEDRLTGRVYEQRVRYLVGADGARSRVAADAGLPIHGEMGRAGTVYAQFAGDLSRYMGHRPSVLIWIADPSAAVGEIGLGLLRAVHPWDRWIAGWGFDLEQGAPDVSHETARARIRAYVGDPGFEPEILGVSPWYVNEASASSYSAGRIFCGGDAVHRHPPSNGLGSNTCIQDAFNLAWKLAYVLSGDAAPELLESYTDERAPVGRQVVERANQSRRDYAPLKAVLRDAFGAAEDGGRPDGGLLTASSPDGARARDALASAIALKDYEFNALGVELNHRYESAAVLPDGAPPEEWEHDRELVAQATTRPGAKLPHAWLVGTDGRRISTLDVVGDGAFTLLTGLSGTVWADAVVALGHPRLRHVVIGTAGAEDLYLEWRRVREIDEDGALLVRPDGYIAWRAATASTTAREDLESALTRVLGFGSTTHTRKGSVNDDHHDENDHRDHESGASARGSRTVPGR